MDDDELAAKEELERWLGNEESAELSDQDIPIERVVLEGIPRRLWEQTLALYPRSHRTLAVRQISDPALQERAWEVAHQLDRAESTRTISRQRQRQQAAARRRGAPLPVPGPDHRAVEPTVQVNTRLRPDDHARLRQAAAAVGLRPTTLARALVLNGVAMILREHPELASES